MHLILTICSFVQHIITGKYAGLPTNELRTKLRIDLLDFHSFFLRSVAEDNSATLDDNLQTFSMTFLAKLQSGHTFLTLFWVYLGVETCDIFLCFGAIVFLLSIVFDALCCFVRSLFTSPVSFTGSYTEDEPFFQTK